MSTRAYARIGLIGAGWWGTSVHLPSLTQYPRAKVVAIADPNEQKLNKAAEVFAIPHRYTSFEQMLDEQELDGVVVATTHATHYPIGREVLRRGVGLMVEKPMVLRAREARELNELAAQHHAPLIVGYPYLFNPQNRALRAKLAAGAIGELQLVDVLFTSTVMELYRGTPSVSDPSPRGPLTGPGADSYSNPAIGGGGQGHLQMTHAASLLLWLTGLRPKEVTAFMSNLEVAVDVCDAITARFEGGAIGTLTSTGNIPGSQGRSSHLEYRIFGSQGFAQLDAKGVTCSLHYPDGTIETIDAPSAEEVYPSHRTSRHLVDVLLGDAENESSGIDGAAVVELLDAAYRSVAERRIVTVDELYA